MTQPLPHVKLDILSDPICPWCYIGKTLLDQALAAQPDHPFVIEWHPFQLNPDMPAGGMDRREYLEAKFGGKDNAVKVYAQIADHAAEAGVEINFEAMQRTPNTVDAHRLIHWAGLESKQSPVVDALFQAYFVEGLDIGDHAVLCDVAERAGMERAVVAKLLSGDSDIEDIQSRDAHSREVGVNSVPTFIIANQHVVPGAQQPELWTQVIADIRSQLSANTDTAETDNESGTIH
ncbi:DsbA family oxidoreductase [Tritonibacter scottomollicae]|uniref:DsbA family oxidoreductase n=1 Tax=Tritonibacter scottomollicae TaxID=483013 RepID=A0ABZ0HI67_TRISK|nr:DsbA family oxidoreductase [Tritonibacter scottomollicae]WOI34137.1 DsbA family oxidoreductase [Tritonibacter scottomollicae]